LDSKSIIKD